MVLLLIVALVVLLWGLHDDDSDIDYDKHPATTIAAYVLARDLQGIKSIFKTKNVDMDIKNHALRCASEVGWFDGVSYLLKQGADIKAKDFLGRDAFLLALLNKHFLIASLFIIAGAVDINAIYSSDYIEGECTALSAAISTNNIEAVHFLVDEGVNINIQDSKGQTALHIAAVISPSIYEYLIQHGADSLIKDREGCTPGGLFHYYHATN